MGLLLCGLIVCVGVGCGVFLRLFDCLLVCLGGLLMFDGLYTYMFGLVVMLCCLVVCLVSCVVLLVCV